MKKITFLFFFITLITFKTTAQDSKIKFGLQGGVNYSSFRGYKSFMNDNPGFAYVFGVSLEYQIEENLSIKADINYERKSQISKTSINILDVPPFEETYSYKINTFRNYIILPVLLKYDFTKENSFYLNGGPFIGYLLKSGASSDINSPRIENEDLDNTKNMKSLDYGISFGIGKQFEVSQNHQIYIELRENLGLANISKSGFMSDDEIKTNSLNLLAGFTFN